MTLTSTTPNQTFNGILQQCSLNGVLFPVEEVDFHFDQVIAEHRYPHVEGSHVESIKMGTRHFVVKALFLTDGSIRKSSYETWTNLYPETFQTVYAMITDNTNPPLNFVHPTLGNFTVKVSHGSIKTTPHMLNGQTIDFELIEDTTNAQPQNPILSTSDAGAGSSAAQTFDNNYQVFLADDPTAASDIPVDLQDISVSTIYATATSYNVGVSFQATINPGFTATSLFQVEVLENNLNALNTSTTGAMQVQLEIVKAGLYQIQAGQAVYQSTLGSFIVRVPMTLSAALLTINGVNNLNVSMEQLVSNNPNILTNGPLLPVGTVVKYPLLKSVN